MTVYKLKINLGSPMALSDPFFNLDSFLSYAAALEEKGYNYLKNLNEYRDDPEYFEDVVPLEKASNSELWIWKSSVVMNKEIESIKPFFSTTKWRKRFDVDLSNQKKKTQIDIQSGKYKSYNASLPYCQLQELVFFFEGDKKRVKKLIEDHLTHLGKKTSQGFGEIRESSITESNRDSAIYSEDKTLRSIPADFLSSYPKGVKLERRSIRPPYWHPDNQKFALLPFEEVEESIFYERIL